MPEVWADFELARCADGGNQREVVQGQQGQGRARSAPSEFEDVTHSHESNLGHRGKGISNMNTWYRVLGWALRRDIGLMCWARVVTNTPIESANSESIIIQFSAHADSQKHTHRQNFSTRQNAELHLHKSIIWTCLDIQHALCAILQRPRSQRPQ